MRVLVHSAAGGVGQLLVQLALDAGASCTRWPVARKTAHHGHGRSQHVIDRHQGDYAERLRQLGKDR